jgi:hypothetical protein
LRSEDVQSDILCRLPVFCRTVARCEPSIQQAEKQLCKRRLLVLFWRA